MRKLLFYYAALSLGATAACTVHQDTAPSLTGPSTNAISMTVTATPDTLAQDGVSQSQIVVKMFDSAGHPIAGQQVRIDMQVGNVTQDFGTLSRRNVATASDGSASTIYTAPGGTNAGGAGTMVTFIASRVSGDAVNQDGFLSQASIRLTPVGTVTAPPSAGGGTAVPTGSFTSSPSSPGLNQNVFFNASQSTAAAGHTITTYDWNFGDGNLGFGVTTSHAYTRAGTYTVTLTVFDDLGQAGVKTGTVTVAATSGALVAEFTSSPSDPSIGQTVNFDSTPSVASPGATLATWFWDFGDGNTCGNDTG